MIIENEEKKKRNVLLFIFGYRTTNIIKQTNTNINKHKQTTQTNKQIKN